MKFFIPQAKKTELDDVYSGIIAALKDQLHMPIDERRIFSLEYVRGKKRYRAEVGQLEQAELRYEVLAIFESKVYIVFTRSKSGDHGVTILVDKDEVISAVDFD